MKIKEIYLADHFDMGILSDRFYPDQMSSPSQTVNFREIELEEVKRILAENLNMITSRVAGINNSIVLSERLGFTILSNRASYQLELGDILIVARMKTPGDKLPVRTVCDKDAINQLHVKFIKVELLPEITAK